MNRGWKWILHGATAHFYSMLGVFDINIDINSNLMTGTVCCLGVRKMFHVAGFLSFFSEFK